MNELERYYKEALLNDLCGEYKGYWRSANGDKRRLVNLVLQQQSLPHFLTYSYNGKGLSKEYIMREFKGYINGNYTGIDVDGVVGDYKTQLYVGYNSVLSPVVDVLCAMWCNIPLLEIKATKAMKLYVGAGSDVKIDCGGYNSLTIMLFDNSCVWLNEVDEDSTVTVFKYSDECEVKDGRFCFGKVKEFRKELRL